MSQLPSISFITSCLVAAGLQAFLSGCTAERQPASSSLAAKPDSVQSASVVERGRYVANAANCGACHTASPDQPFAGGVAFETPYGTLYSPNITPDPVNGIGKWSDEQFLRSLRKGLRADGTHLYPVFPYPAFTKMTPVDSLAVLAYLRTLTPVSFSPPDNQMRFPYKFRSLMGLWNWLYLREGPLEPDPARSDEWNRGAYLVTALSHCSACHSPRNILGAEKAQMAMTGGVHTDRVGNGAQRLWSAPNLTGTANGLGAWPEAELVAYLKTGTNAFATTFGPMNEVIQSTQHLSEPDVLAMAKYLKSLPPLENEDGSAASTDVLQAGEALYDVNCGTCHQPNGLGAQDAGPRLAGSLIVQTNDPASLINIILHGPDRPDPAPPTHEWRDMEAYGEKLTDEEIAALASYLRSAWANKSGAVTAVQVGKQREHS